MLRDLPSDWSPPTDEWHTMLRSLSEDSNLHPGGRSRPVRLYRGIYLSHINFNHELEGLITNDWPEFPATECDDWEVGGSWFNCYGVVDHFSQLPLRRLEEDPRNLIVLTSSHRRDRQPESGGWRWHKWGPYLGVFREQVDDHEYLYDTPDVVEVFSYRIHEVNF